MKAFALTSLDQPAALVDLPLPDLADDAVLISIRAASINGFDVFQASGFLIGMMEHVLPTTVGRDFAGVVERVGPAHTGVAAGDEVLGFIPSTPPLHEGTFAEQLVTSNIVLARKPSGLSFEDAAAIPLAGSTALDAVDAVDIGPGDIVVVAGATGGVGAFAVQIAARRGATVIATARAGDEDAFVRSIGATETVEYSHGETADAIRARYPDGVVALIDMVNRDEAAFAPMAALVRDGGRIATTLGAADADGLARRDVRATNVMGAPTPDKLDRLAALVVSGELRVEVQRTFPLADVAEALQAFSAGTMGKLVLVTG